MSEYKYLVAISGTLGDNSELSAVCSGISSLMNSFCIPRSDSVLVYLGNAIAPAFDPSIDRKYTLDIKNTYSESFTLPLNGNLSSLRSAKLLTDNLEKVISSYEKQYSDFAAALSYANLPVIACPGQFDVYELMKKEIVNRGWTFLHGTAANICDMNFFGYGGIPSLGFEHAKALKDTRISLIHEKFRDTYTEYGISPELFTSFSESDLAKINPTNSDGKIGKIDVSFHYALPRGFKDESFLCIYEEKINDLLISRRHIYMRHGSIGLKKIIDAYTPAIDISGLGINSASECIGKTLLYKCSAFSAEKEKGKFPIYFIRLNKKGDSFRVVDNIDLEYQFTPPQVLDTLDNESADGQTLEKEVTEMAFNPNILLHEVYDYTESGLPVHHNRRLIRDDENGDSKIFILNTKNGNMHSKPLKDEDLPLQWAFKNWAEKI